MDIDTTLMYLRPNHKDENSEYRDKWEKNYTGIVDLHLKSFRYITVHKSFEYKGLWSLRNIKDTVLSLLMK
jgi:hypothetical protein